VKEAPQKLQFLLQEMIIKLFLIILENLLELLNYIMMMQQIELELELHYRPKVYIFKVHLELLENLGIL